MSAIACLAAIASAQGTAEMMKLDPGWTPPPMPPRREPPAPLISPVTAFFLGILCG